MHDSIKRSSSYRPSLDGLRAICIALTLANHVKGFTVDLFLNFGVDIFFALSGWLITWLLLNDDRQSSSLKGFYIRRFFRIVPLYYFAILLYALAALVLRLNRYPDLLLLTFNPEYRIGEGELVGHAWTLGIEEKFYIIWPALLAFLPSRRGVAWIIATTLALVLISVAGFADPVIRGYFGLGAGATLALSSTRNDTVRALLGRAWIAEVAVAAIFATVAATLVFRLSWYGNVVISGASAFLVASLWLKPVGIVSRILSLRPLPFLGTLTYAFYLLHVLALNAVEVLFRISGMTAPAWVILVSAYGASVMIAWPAHVFIEVPLIAVGRRLAERTFGSTPVVT